VTALILAGCGGRYAEAPPAGPQASAAPPGAAPVSARLAGQAAAFESFTRRASAISPGFSGPGEIAKGLQTAAGYEPRQLEAGMVAYAAVAALQEPGFAEAVRRAGGRDLARRLTADPHKALDLPGASRAAARANAALHRRGAALADAGREVRQASYSVQRHAWSRARISNAARLAEVKRLGSVGYQRRDGDAARLFAAVSEGGRRSGLSPVVVRGVALAALSAVGEEARGRTLMAEPRSSMCLRLAKLNYHQCLASAGTPYEDIYCLGVHAMAETGQCVVDATKPSRTRVAAR
jgi:hypothetical protein